MSEPRWGKMERRRRSPGRDRAIMGLRFLLLAGALLWAAIIGVGLWL